MNKCQLAPDRAAAGCCCRNQVGASIAATAASYQQLQLQQLLLYLCHISLCNGTVINHMHHASCMLYNYLFCYLNLVLTIPTCCFLLFFFFKVSEQIAHQQFSLIKYLIVCFLFYFNNSNLKIEGPHIIYVILTIIWVVF